MSTPLERTVELLGAHPFDDPLKFRSILLDLSGERTAFNTVLIHCVEAGIASRLVECTEGFALKLQMTSAVERLHNEFGTDRQLASDVVAAIAAFAQVTPVSKPPVISEEPLVAPPLSEKAVETKVIPSFDTQPLASAPKVEPDPVKPQIISKPPTPIPAPTPTKSPLGWIVGLVVLFTAVVIAVVIWRAVNNHSDGTPITSEQSVSLKFNLSPKASWEQEATFNFKVNHAEYAGSGTPTTDELANVNSAVGTRADVVMRSKFEVTDATLSQTKLHATIKDVTVNASGILENSIAETKKLAGKSNDLTFNERGFSEDTGTEVSFLALELPDHAIRVGDKFQTHLLVMFDKVEADAEVILFEWHSNRKCAFVRLKPTGNVDPGFANSQPIPVWIDMETGQIVEASFLLKSSFVESSVRLEGELEMTFRIVEAK